MTRTRTLAAIVVGGAIFIATQPLLPYFSGMHNSFTVWQLSTLEPVVMTIVAASAIAFAAISLHMKGKLPPLLALGSSFVLLGRAVPLNARVYGVLGAGCWLALATAVVMSVAGVIVVVGLGVDPHEARGR